MIDFKETAEGTLPGIVTFDTELETEGQRPDLLMTVIERVAQRQGIIAEDVHVQKTHWQPWDKEACVILPDGRKIVGELVFQREWYKPSKGKHRWTEHHEVHCLATQHKKIEYIASLRIAP